MDARNIPVVLTSFVGRERERAELQCLLASTRLVTLTGAGGCGKTRLAIQLANSVTAQFADGIWLISLVPLRDPALIPQLIAQTLGIQPPPDRPLLEVLCSYLRPRQLLLILDNCEHLLSACATLAQQLLAQADKLRILATSRGALGLAGEMVYPLHGLAWPTPATALLHLGQAELGPQDLLSYDAVRLFVARAQALVPGFALTPNNAPVVGEICRRLDGLPLAIELASARVRVLSVQQIAARLDDRFALLTAGPHAVSLPHHQTLRTAIDWSYALLAPEEQAVFRCLAVFVSGCALDSAEAVCADATSVGGRVLERLAALVDQSLVVAETTSRAEARYLLLETIREYALQQLELAGEAAELRDRHLALFLARAEDAAPKLHDTYQQLWLGWLEGEHDNLRAALSWALECGQIEAGLRIANALLRFWEIRGYVREGMGWLEQLLGRADDRVPALVRAQACAYAAFLSDFLGRPTATEAFANQAVALAEAAGDVAPHVLGMALSAQGTSARAQGAYQRAFELTRRVTDIYRDEPLPAVNLGMALLVRGGLAIELKAYAAAQVALEESLALAQAAGDAFRSAHALNTLGDLARCQGHYAQAELLYAQSIAQFHQIGTTRDLAAPLLGMGHTCLHLGEVGRARVLFEESLAMMEAEQPKVWAGQPVIAVILVGFAALAVVSGAPAAGARLLFAAQALGMQHAKFSREGTRIEHEHALALAQARLSPAELQAEEAAGRALTLDEAIAFTRGLAAGWAPAPSLPAGRESLSARERDVARLIAQGHTNSEIAVALVLSKRTVEKHIANILAKLNLANRAQIVRWAIERGLGGGQ